MSSKVLTGARCRVMINGKEIAWIADGPTAYLDMRTPFENLVRVLVLLRVHKPEKKALLLSLPTIGTLTITTEEE